MRLKNLFLLIFIVTITFIVACNNSTKNPNDSPKTVNSQSITIDLVQSEKELNALYAQIIKEFKETKATTLLNSISKETRFKSELKDNKWTSDGEKIRTTLEDNLKAIKEVNEISSKISSIKAGENGSIILEIDSSIAGKYVVPNTPITADLTSKGKSSVTWIKKENSWQMIAWQDLGGTMTTDGNESEGSYFLGL
ncbi:MAG: hypothetical protein HY819_10760 [Acidobacteria bacterium]|nr:hypothetical protein [Acidobacteriota bacterium]